LAYKPLILDDAQVPETVINLLSKGPFFSPTPLDPLDLAELEEDLLDPQNFKRFLSNISKEDSRAFTDIKNLKKNGFYIL
jgi:hypothetical protein